ncbi:MAG TPA: hypothetical protein VGP82_17900 [Ktedonobacterales bacterium]|nr:hypothetical protein [Ktedonobacterales bacterium]
MIQRVYIRLDRLFQNGERIAHLGNGRPFQLDGAEKLAGMCRHVRHALARIGCSGRARRLLREVSANLGSVLWAFDDLFDPSSRHEVLPAWPKTASALASTFYGGWASNWSLEDSSSAVVLDRD